MLNWRSFKNGANQPATATPAKAVRASDHVAQFNKLFVGCLQLQNGTCDFSIKQYSLDSLKDSKTDILGWYLTSQSREPEITLFVDSCPRTSRDLSVSFDDLLQIVVIHELAHHATASATIVDYRAETIRGLIMINAAATYGRACMNFSRRRICFYGLRSTAKSFSAPSGHFFDTSRRSIAPGKCLMSLPRIKFFLTGFAKLFKSSFSL